MMILIFKIAVWCLVCLHVAKPFIISDITMVIGIIAVLVFLSGLTIMGRSYRKATLTFFVVGAAMLLYFGEPVSIWLLAAGSMTNVIAILVMMQIFSISIQVGEYDLAIRYWLTRFFKNENGLFLFTTVATHVFTSFLMFGAIPVMVSLMEHTLKDRVKSYEWFMATATSRGYALASLWAPGAINLFLVVQATGVSWSSVFVPGMILSVLGMMISYLLEAKRLSDCRNQTHESVQAAVLPISVEKGKAAHIIGVVWGLIFFTLLFDKIHIGNSSNRILIAGLLVGVSWILVFLKHPLLMPALEKYWENGVVKAGDLAPFFIAMGIFSTALEQSEILGNIQTELQTFAGWLGTFAIVLIPLLVIAAAVLAIHPFITIVMFGKILTVLNLPVSVITIALCLALGGSISYMVSPFAGVIMTIAKFVNTKASDVAIVWNWRFCSLYFVIGILFAYVWGQWVAM